MLTKCAALFMLLTATGFSCAAQDTVRPQTPDTTTQAATDTTLPAKPFFDKRDHSPLKAGLFSMALPGLGQVYNQKYWKIPIIYVAFGALAYSIQFNGSRFFQFRDAHGKRIDNDSTTVDQYVGQYNENQLKTLRDFYQRRFELSIIGAGAVYILNIIDATVDAHLYNFNVSDNLSLEVRPRIRYSANPGSFHGVSIKLRL